MTEEFQETDQQYQNEIGLGNTNNNTAFYQHVFYKYNYQKDKYQFISPTIERLSGYKIDEMNKIGFDTIVRKKLVDQSLNHSRNGKEGTQIEENYITCLIETRDGDFKWIEDNSFTLLDNSGKRTSRIGFIKDITAEMRDEKIKQVVAEILEASNSNKNLDEFFSFIHSCIKKLMKADNFYIAYYHRDEDVLSFPYFVDEFDTNPSPKKLGKGLTEYVLHTGISALVDKEEDERLIKEGKVDLVGPQSEIWLGVPLKIKDVTIGALVMQDYNDVTTYTESDKNLLDVISHPISRAIERRMVEEEREAMIKELTKLNQSKDQLFSLISHDLRTPFNSLLGFAEILTAEYDTLTQRDIKEYLKVINDSARSLFGMTSNLLHYSRYQLGKFQYDPQEIYLEELLKNVLSSYKETASKKEILIKKDILQDTVVYADEEMLSIAIQNVISNAIKFSNNGGIVNISAIQQRDESDIGNIVEIRFMDEGVGISTGDMQKIKNGEMFSSPGTNKESGSGLGLCLVKDFITTNKGSFDIQSEYGKGTTVKLLLPVIQDE